MKRKIRELSGRELDAAVAIANGNKVFALLHPTQGVVYLKNQPGVMKNFFTANWVAEYSSSPFLAYAIQDENGISVATGRTRLNISEKWSAWYPKAGLEPNFDEVPGPDVMTAICRCYAVAMMGEEVDLPEVEEAEVITLGGKA